MCTRQHRLAASGLPSPRIWQQSSKMQASRMPETTHFRNGLPSIPRGDQACRCPLVNAATAPSWERRISSVTQEKLKGHFGSRDRNDESTLKAASRSNADFILFSHDPTLGTKSDRERDCRARNLENVWLTIDELNIVMNPISAANV